MAISKKISNAQNQIRDDFSINEDESIDISSFSDGEAKIDGTLLRSFSFDSDEELIEQSLDTPATLNSTQTNLTVNEPFTKSSNEINLTYTTTPINFDNQKDIVDHRTLKTNPNGRTPAVDGEAFDMVRSYTLRRSTVRILSKIKAIHEDDNVYLNTIVDEAIRYYYDYLKSNLWKIKCLNPIRHLDLGTLCFSLAYCFLLLIVDSDKNYAKVFYIQNVTLSYTFQDKIKVNIYDNLEIDFNSIDL